jgi:hypothetical protein
MGESAFGSYHQVLGILIMAVVEVVKVVKTLR